jgi:type IX secretion system PorP/SprF family membrane protein
LKKQTHISKIKYLLSRIILGFGMMFCVLESSAQQDPMYTQYMENLVTINPAYAGSKDLLSVMFVSRNQWVSMPDAPFSNTLSLNSPIKDLNMGLGFSIMSDKIGPIKQTGFYLDYAYRLYFNNKRTLSLGLKGGVNFYDANLTDLPTNDPNDPVFSSDINRNFLPNLGVGAFFYTDQYYIGLSFPKLIENTINKNAVATENISKEEIHVYFMSGYVFDLNRIVKFKPSILTKYVKNSPLAMEFGATLLFYDTFWLGAIYRIGDSFAGMCQFQITKQLKVGYSYDFPVNQLGIYNNGTHEVMINFDFDLKPGKVRSPRYF